MSRDWSLYLNDLVESAEKIERLLRGQTFDSFCDSEAIFDAVLFNLQVIGEAAKKLPEEATRAMPSIDWSRPARLRDLIAHHYFALDAGIVWDVATHHIPEVRVAARELLNSLRDKENPSPLG